VPDLRTEVTEIITGLSMLGYRELDHALGVRPRMISHVTEEHFDRLDAARSNGEYAAEFETAWENGQIFAEATDGLRGRPPWRVEWKGPHRPPGYEQVPADLRVDHVYLISCKYGSNILFNASPSHLFERLLAERRVERSSDWYEEVAPEAYQDFYAACRQEVGLSNLPFRASDLNSDHRAALKAALPRGGAWPTAVNDEYQWFVHQVSLESAQMWKAKLGTRNAREEMLWRLLRLQAAPYYVLGAAPDGSPLRFRVGTPWDFRDQFEVKAFDVWGDTVGQPLVRWRADVRHRESDESSSVEGHVEVRWSHGRFGGAPEAKVYLDTPHHQVAGYFELS
jgi:hypothetical protein